MPKQSLEEKAASYLTQGKIQVRLVADDKAKLIAIGSGSSPYSVEFKSEVGWQCNCPSYTECAHILASKIIIPHLLRKERTVLGTLDEDLNLFLDSVTTNFEEEDFS